MLLIFHEFYGKLISDEEAFEILPYFLRKLVILTQEESRFFATDLTDITDYHRLKELVKYLIRANS